MPQRMAAVLPSAPAARPRSLSGPLAACLAATLFVGGGCRTSAAGGPVPLGEETFDAWRAYLVPGGADEAWRQIPWRASFAEGLRDAAREQKPLLLWGMNGHPLGAT